MMRSVLFRMFRAGFSLSLGIIFLISTAAAGSLDRASLQLCCKQLMPPLGQNWHCYVSYSNAKGGETTIGLHAVGSNPLIARQGEVKLNAAYDLGDSHGRRCGAAVADTKGKLWKAIVARADAYPNPSYYDGVIGPNSNSFAGYLGKDLPRPVLPLPLWGEPAPGLDHSPAPAYPTFLPLARHGAVLFRDGPAVNDLRSDEVISQDPGYGTSE